MESKKPVISGEKRATPICSVIVPTRDKLNFLKPCIESVLASEDADSIEIVIVDNESVEPETKDYLRSLDARPNIRILEWNEAFNFSAINNFAAQQCLSDTVCFLNNDIEIKDPQWLGKLLRVIAIDEVGAVGCTLLYPDSHIQHAGIALDEKTMAQHIAVGEDSDFLTRIGITLPYVVDAVTAACLVMRRDLFLRMGGFNEDQLAVAFNDVDLCLRLADKGLPVLCHPGVALIHHESVSRHSDELPANRKRALKEHAFMQFRWRIRLMGRSFVSGIPDHIKQMALQNEESGAALSHSVKAAADALYLQDSASRSSSKEMRNMYSGRHRTLGDPGLLSQSTERLQEFGGTRRSPAERAGDGGELNLLEDDLSAALATRYHIAQFSETKTQYRASCRSGPRTGRIPNREPASREAKTR